MGGDADREVADLAGQLDQVDRVGELRGRQVGVVGDVAAEGHDVLDAGVAVVLQDLASSRARVWPTQTRWAIAVRRPSRWIRVTRSKVRWRDSRPPR